MSIDSNKHKKSATAVSHASAKGLRTGGVEYDSDGGKTVSAIYYDIRGNVIETKLDLSEKVYITNPYFSNYRNLIVIDKNLDYIWIYDSSEKNSLYVRIAREPS